MRRLSRHELRHPDGRRLWIYGRLRGALPSGPAQRLDSRRPGLHQRYDALTDGWIAVSPARNVRPQMAGTEPDPAPFRSARACPLCPGGPEVPFAYDAAVFENRWPALVHDPPPVADRADPWQAPSLGRCEVVLYTPSHTGSLATLSSDELARVVAIWVDRTTELWTEPDIAFVMAFENRGAAVGATIGHPHGQIYAFDRLPPLIDRRVSVLSRYRAAAGTCLSCAVVARDAADTNRIVETSHTFTVGVPFAPHWPFEVHIRVREHGVRRLADLPPPGRGELARLLRRVVMRYDALFGMALPYMMTIIEAPATAPDHHLAIEFLPPARTATLAKVRASVETATGLVINDTEPEATADRLRRIEVDERIEREPIEVVNAS